MTTSPTSAGARLIDGKAFAGALRERVARAVAA